MTAQIGSTNPVGKETTPPNWTQRPGLFVLFLICGLLVFVVFSHYYPFYKENTDIVGRIVVAAVFLTLALFVRFSERWQKYWLIPFAFFAALTAISVDHYIGLSEWITPVLGVEAESPTGLAIDKLESSLLGIVIVLVLNRLAGQSMGSLYIRRGRLRLGFHPVPCGHGYAHRRGDFLDFVTKKVSR